MSDGSRPFVCGTRDFATRECERSKSTCSIPAPCPSRCGPRCRRQPRDAHSRSVADVSAMGLARKRPICVDRLRDPRRRKSRVDRQPICSGSFAPVYPDSGSEWIDERVSLSPLGFNRSILDSEASAERFSRAGRAGVVLRFGGFYGHDAFQTTEMISTSGKAGRCCQVHRVPISRRSPMTTRRLPSPPL